MHPVAAIGLEVRSTAGIDRTRVICLPPDMAMPLTSHELAVERATRAYAAAHHLTHDVLELFACGALRLRFTDDTITIERSIAH